MIKNLEKAFKYKDYSNVDWNDIWFYFDHKLSNEVIDYFKDKINWEYLCEYQLLSESIIEKYKDKLEWYNICKYQKLSEKFIEKHKDKVNWNVIAIYQILS